MRLRSHDGGRIFDRQKKFDRTLRSQGGHEIFSLCSRGILNGRRLNIRPLQVIPKRMNFQPIENSCSPLERKAKTRAKLNELNLVLS